MIFDFEPWQVDIDIDLTKQLYRSCKGDFVWVSRTKKSPPITRRTTLRGGDLLSHMLLQYHRRKRA